jgi:hypothetical protein
MCIVLLNTSTLVYHRFLESFHLQKWNSIYGQLYSHWTIFHFPLPTTPDKHHSASCFCEIEYPSYKWNHVVFDLHDRFVSLSVISMLYNIKFPSCFKGWIIVHFVYILLFHASIDGELNCYLLFIIVNYGAMKMEYRYFFNMLLSILLDINSLDGISILVSTAGTPFYICTNSTKGCNFWHPHQHLFVIFLCMCFVS